VHDEEGLGHELRHALEIAQYREIRGDAAMQALSARIGRRTWGQCYETDAAQAVTDQVRAEVHGVCPKRGR
jgi:hypothetical protein